MPTEALVAALVLLLALTFWRPLRRVRSLLGVSHLLSTGHAFLVLGFLAGLAGGEWPVRVVEEISPVVAFVAGWIGFATGMRFDLRVLRAVPARAYVVALVPALTAALVVGGGCLAVMRVAEVPWTQALAAAFVVGGAASSSGPTLAAILRSRRAGRAAHVRGVLRMIEFSAGVDDIVVVVLAVLAFALFRADAASIAPIWFVVLSVLGGAMLGAITWLFLGGRAGDDERMLLSLAMLAFTAGFAGWLDLSPAGVAALAAVVLVNLPGERMAQLVETVHRVERPAVVILMTVIGYHAGGTQSWLVGPLVLTLTLVRWGVKHMTGRWLAGPIRRAPGLVASRRWGDGLVPQGTFGLMVCLSFFHVWRDEVSLAVLAAVAAASLLNELAGAWLLLALVRDRLSRLRAPGAVAVAEGRP
jgi:hypothetical protein